MVRQKVKRDGTFFGLRTHPAGGIALLVIAVLTLGCGTRVSGRGWDPNVYLKLQPVSGDTARLLYNTHYYRLMGRPELALQELEAAHQKDPGNLQLADTLAQLYDELGQGQRARQIYQEALALNPDHPVLNNNLGFSYYLAGKWQEAETCFRRILDRQPNNEAARNNLGLLWCRQGRPEEARRLWERAGGRAAADQKLAQAMAALGMAGSGPVVARAPQPPPETPPATRDPSLRAQRTVGASGSQAPVPARTRVQAPQKPERVASVNLKKSDTVGSPGVGSSTSDSSGTRTEAPPHREAAVAVRPKSAPPARQPGDISPQVSTVSTKRPASRVPPPVAVQPQPEKPAPPTEARITKKSLPHLTARDLIETNIEVRNGHGIQDLAHEMRARLSQEGFNVVSIANHIDFGMEKTTIYYRPQGEKIAQALQGKFFPQAEVRPATKLAAGIDVKVVLGHELSAPGQMMAKGVSEGKAM
jgi:Tfp pilus assembly protein PilF